jgi:hypothetical protein
MLAGATGLKPATIVVTVLNCRPVFTNPIRLVVKTC